MWKKSIKVLGIYILVVVIFGVITQLIPELTGALTKTEILQYEEMQINDRVECYIVRDEKVYFAPTGGHINYYVENGTKIKKNSKVVDISYEKLTREGESSYSQVIERIGSTDRALSQLQCAENGVVSYYVDGYEDYFKPETIESLNFDATNKLKISVINLTRKETFSGDPLFKICNGNKWYLIAWVEAANISKYEEGGMVKIDLPKGQISAKLEKIIDQDDKWLIVMSSNRYYEDFASKRIVQANIITQDYTGIKIRNSSIVSLNGQAGVYIKAKNGDFVFKPIKILTSDGTHSLTEVAKYVDKEGKEVNTVEVYDEILKNPNEDTKLLESN